MKSKRRKDQRDTVSLLLARNVRAARKRQKITQSTLANAIGVTRISVTLYESGTTCISLAQLYKIAQCLSVEVADLLPPASKVVQKALPVEKKKDLPPENSRYIMQRMGAI